MGLKPFILQNQTPNIKCDLKAISVWPSSKYSQSVVFIPTRILDITASVRFRLANNELEDHQLGRRMNEE